MKKSINLKFFFYKEKIYLFLIFCPQSESFLAQAKFHFQIFSLFLNF